MIHKQFNNPYVLYQESSEEDIPEQAISFCTDNSELIVISQEGRDIILNKESAKEFVKIIKLLTT